MSLGSWRTEGPAERLDRALAAHLDLPRSQVQAWIRAGRIRIDGVAPAKAGQPLRSGQTVTWEAPPPPDGRVLPEAGALTLLHVDEHLVVLDKPAGLTVHPGAGHRAGTLVHRLLDRFPELDGVGGPGRPGIVHRLDKGTSGVLVVARNQLAYRDLVRQFAERSIDKRYLALVRGTPRTPHGRIDAPIGRHPRDRQRMAVRAGGRAALSVYRTLAATGGIALLEVQLLTGRTHQIRVHLSHLGHPILGDPTYGAGGPRNRRAVGALAHLARPALHAWRITLEHPASGERRAFEAPIAADLAQFWREATGTPLPELRR